MKPHRIIAALLLFHTSISHASSLKLNGSFGSNYSDFGAIARWSLDKEKTSSIMTSAETTNASGDTTNEFKFGYSTDATDTTSYSITGYFRSEPGEVSVIGIEPGISLSYDDLILEERNTSFSIGVEFSRSGTNIPVTSSKKVSESFTTVGLSLTAEQEILETLSANIGLSFFNYSTPQYTIPGKKARRLNNMGSTASGSLSTNGYPERTFSFGVNWDFMEKWSASYDLYNVKAHFEDTTTSYSTLGVSHDLNKDWNAELSYTWSSSDSSTITLGCTYHW